MLRYPRLYLHFLRFSFSRALEFRLDFYFRVVMDVVFYSANLVFFAVVYSHTSLVGGWTVDQIYIFVCAIFVIDAVHMTVFSNNIWWMPVYINRGDLDYYLVRPVSPLFFLSLREFAANSFLNLVIAVGLQVWALARYPDELGAGRLALFVLYLCLGSAVYYLVRMLFVIPVFWIQSTRGLDGLFYSVERLAERPHQIYTGLVRRALLSIFPLAFVTSVPTHVLFDGLTFTGFLHALAVVGGSLALVIWFWRRGLRAYSSASS
jgi:ABC-2 type transport system permease protein